MGHLLRTMNPQAADYANELRPMPIVGMFVHYYPRAGEVRRGRKRVAALVVHTDEDNRLLDLVIVHDANDFVDQQRVPERRGDDRGWVRMEDVVITDASGQRYLMPGFGEDDGSEIKGDVEALRESVATLSGKFDDLAKRVNNGGTSAAVAPAPRRPGRPRKIDQGQQQG